MPLSFNEIRNRAAKFAKDWENARYEKGQTQTFYNEFFEVFGKTQNRASVNKKHLISVILSTFENKSNNQIIHFQRHQYFRWFTNTNNG